MWNKQSIEKARQYYICLCTLCLSLISVHVSAQERNEQDPQILRPPLLMTSLPDKSPTPRAAELYRYGNIPVSYHIGRADVSIPIFSTVQNGIPLDVNLGYDTSGLLMSNLPSWTGHGWTLNAGGIITREQNQDVDEFEYDNDNILGMFFSNYFQCCDLLSNQDTSTIYEGLLENVVSDYQADIFHFNFMGHTGYFFYGGDREWHVCSDDNLAVVFDVDDSDNFINPVFTTYPGNLQFHQPKAIKGFTIFDDKGNKYIFGGIAVH